MAMQESGEMYLETILILLQENGRVRSVDIAEHMGFSKPSVSRAVSLLKERGHIKVDGQGSITLTESGRAIAEAIYERHTILTEVLVSIGVDRETAAADACRAEHYISEATFEAIKAHMCKYGHRAEEY